METTMMGLYVYIYIYMCMYMSLYVYTYIHMSRGFRVYVPAMPCLDILNVQLCLIFARRRCRRRHGLPRGFTLTSADAACRR